MSAKRVEDDVAEFEAQMMDGSLVTLAAESMQADGSLIVFYQTVDGQRTLIAALAASNVLAVYDRRADITIEGADEDDEDWELSADDEE